MPDTPERINDYLVHMLQAISRIQEYVADMEEAAFLADTRTQDAVIRNLEILGEASNNVLKRHPDFAAAHTEIPWALAYEMRNILAHGYFTVDVGIVWRTIVDDLPDLKSRLEEILSTPG